MAELGGPRVKSRGRVQVGANNRNINKRRWATSINASFRGGDVNPSKREFKFPLFWDNVNNSRSIGYRSPRDRSNLHTNSSVDVTYYRQIYQFYLVLCFLRSSEFSSPRYVRVSFSVFISTKTHSSGIKRIQRINKVVSLLLAVRWERKGCFEFALE